MNIKALNQPVADNVSFIISTKGLKQKAVAEKAGISVQAFNDMLNGRRLIKMTDTRSIANALEIDVGELFKNNSFITTKSNNRKRGENNASI